MSQQAIIRVGIVEDQVLFREGIKAILNSNPDLAVVFESPDGFSVLERLKASDPLPDVMLVDLSLPKQNKQEYNGLHLTQALTAAYPDMKILILSVHDDENFIVEMVKNGAHGYLVKDCNPSEVFEAIRSVHAKGSYINTRALMAIQASMGRKPRTRQIIVNLSDRELEVLKLVCQQYTAEEIAAKLFLSVKTVNGHRNNLLLKTGSKNVTGLVLYAVRNNIVQVF